MKEEIDTCFIEVKMHLNPENNFPYNVNNQFSILIKIILQCPCNF